MRFVRCTLFACTTKHPSPPASFLQLHLIEVKDDVGNLDVTCVGVYNHPKEIWHIAPCPTNPQLVFTCYNTGIPNFSFYNILCSVVRTCVCMWRTVGSREEGEQREIAEKLVVRSSSFQPSPGQNEFNASLWNIEDPSEQDLQEVLQLKSHSGTVKWYVHCSSERSSFPLCLLFF